MRKIIVTTGIITVVILMILLSIPIFFKPILLEKVKTSINKSVHAEVLFSDLKISIFRNFPKLSFELTDVTVKGIDEFESDTLFISPSIRAKTELFQLFNKDGATIEEIILIRPKLKLIVDSIGSANWNIVPVTESVEERSGEDSEEGGLKMQLDRIGIKDACFSYDDRESGMLFQLDQIDIDLSGSLYGTEALLLAEGVAKRALLNYDGINYIDNSSVETRTTLSVDYEKMDIIIKENELFLNRLPLEVLGEIKMPDDTMYFDLQIQTKESGFDNFLALLPKDYEHYLENVKSEGDAVISGAVKGFYFNDNYPEFQLLMNIDKGSVQYTTLPEPIKNISSEIAIFKPQGELDQTAINIKRAHAEIKNSPVDLSLSLRNLISDPRFEGHLKGYIDFDAWKDAIPLENITISGNIDADLNFKGSYSAIEKEQYDKIASNGSIILSDFKYRAPDLTQEIYIPEGKLLFSPKEITLNRLKLMVGESDFLFSGAISSYWDYLFKKGVLTGQLQHSSSYLNLNELLRLQVVEDVPQSEKKSVKSAENEEVDKSEVLVVSIPENIDISFLSEIQRLLYEKMPIKNVVGVIIAKEGKLALKDLNLSMLNGGVKLTGSYENSEDNSPWFDFGIDLSGMDFKEAFNSLSGFQRMVPIARHSEGVFNSTLQLKGRLDPGFNPILNTISGLGSFSTENLVINESPLFEQLKGILKSEKFKKVKVDDIKSSVEITDGTINLKPFSTRIAGQETNISGNLNPENLLNMRLDFNLQRDIFGSEIQSLLKILPGQERINSLPASVVLNGPVGKPGVKIELDQAKNIIADEVKRSAKENLNKIGEGLKKLLP